MMMRSLSFAPKTVAELELELEAAHLAIDDLQRRTREHQLREESRSQTLRVHEKSLVQSRDAAEAQASKLRQELESQAQHRVALERALKRTQKQTSDSTHTLVDAQNTLQHLEKKLLSSKQAMKQLSDLSAERMNEKDSEIGRLRAQIRNLQESTQVQALELQQMHEEQIQQLHQVLQQQADSMTQQIEELNQLKIAHTQLKIEKENLEKQTIELKAQSQVIVEVATLKKQLSNAQAQLKRLSLQRAREDWASYRLGQQVSSQLQNMLVNEAERIENWLATAERLPNDDKRALHRYASDVRRMTSKLGLRKGN